ncbi:ATP-dependent DNA helicase DinG [Clostridium vincentii]|uniref:ATP-dependent DNA helicase DinG n=2 Tax=Clostridium vincentii TaxID=52704 RepID=A0A2T0BK79_9CLOT|nr:ATP-dependent DNA helicase DinG [Clostridium vincentii]
MVNMKIKKSVRKFVEIVLKTGSLDNRFTTNARAIEGIRAHQRLQKSNEEIYRNYEKEVFLKTEIDMGDFLLQLEGRCDGIISENTGVVVEEIKSTYKPLNEIVEDYNMMHWSQGKIYAYMICKERGLESIDVQLSYYNLDLNEAKSFIKKYSQDELHTYILKLAEVFKIYALLEIGHKDSRDKSITDAGFPFNNYRVGQVELAKACYGTIKEGKTIFIQAPTGIGKTISTIYPSVKAMGKGLAEKIFYLTAKNINKKVAEESIELLREKGMDINSISIVAKEKICINDKVSCNEEDCIYAKNYYEKIRTVIPHILQQEKQISTHELIAYGEEYKVCPFELSLDLIQWCDCIICDYNYIFDPRVYLRRVLDEDGKNSILLVDEAHNLINRARSSYTATLSKGKFLELRREAKGIMPKLFKYINSINKVFIQESNACQAQDKLYEYYNEVPKELCGALKLFNIEAEKILSKKEKIRFNELLLDVYFEVSNFLSISELFGEEYVTYTEIEKNDVVITLFCVDPSSKIRNTIDKCRATILFSATFTPFAYYMKVLGGNNEDYRLRLRSSFSKANLDVYVYRGNTRYKARNRTLSDICSKIIEFIEREKGNYMVFFPSYEYMDKAKKYIEDTYSNINSIWQNASMDEKERIAFLSKFEDGKNIVGFCVMGGLFSEGIDLPGEKLIGAVIVGVGYPKISFQGEIIKTHFKQQGERIAYIYPGMNKVMQAAGRVIRSEEDRGRILLIDDRYTNTEYYNMVPDEWKPLKKFE